jgi:hypothetical protein
MAGWPLHPRLNLVLPAALMVMGCTGAPEPAQPRPKANPERHCAFEPEDPLAHDPILSHMAASCTSLDQCVLSCIRSGCGANVAGGCFHLCGRLIDPSDENRQQIADEYEEIAGLRTINRLARDASVIGVAQVLRVRRDGYRNQTADLEFSELWKSKIAGRVRLDASLSRQCDHSWVEENEQAVFFLEEGPTPGLYRIAGLGWGRFPLREVGGKTVVAGLDPPPHTIEYSPSPRELRRVADWTASFSDLRDRIHELTTEWPPPHAITADEITRRLCSGAEFSSADEPRAERRQ